MTTRQANVHISVTSYAMFAGGRLTSSQSFVSALAATSLGNTGALKRQALSSPTGTLQVFQTTPELFAGKPLAHALI